MVVIFKCSDPYIASRNLEPKDWEIVFEGDLKSCKKYLLSMYNENCSDSYGYASDQAEAVRNSRRNLDGMEAVGRRLDYDSRIWKIVTKSEFQKMQEV